MTYLKQVLKKFTDYHIVEINTNSPHAKSNASSDETLGRHKDFSGSSQIHDFCYRKKPGINVY